MAVIQIGRYKRPGFTPMDPPKRIQKRLQKILNDIVTGKQIGRAHV